MGWQRSTTIFLVIGVVVVVLASAIAYIVINFQPRVELRIGSGIFKTRVATNQTARELGLSGVGKLSADDGIIMAFPSDSTWNIWMNNMKVPIDIVWLDSNKKVVYIVRNADPQLHDDKIFVPLNPARYVVELPAGSVQQYGIKFGDQAEFDLSSYRIE